MKKLTAGIFSVLVGLCAANSADAAIASKAWVEQDFVAKTTYTTDKTGLESAIAEAKKAGTDANSALEAYKTSNDAAVALKADKTALEATNTLVGALPEGTTATTIVGYIDAKTEGIATDAALSELQGKVTTNTTAIATLNGSGDGSVAKTIADYVTGLDLANTYGAKTAVEANANSIAAIEASDYATSGITSAKVSAYDAYASQINAKEDASNKADTTAKAAEIGEGAYPTVGLVNSLISTANNLLSIDVAANTQGIAAEKLRAEGAESALDSRLTTAEGSITTLTGSGEGSVAKALADAKAYADTKAGEANSSASSDLADYKQTVENTYATQEALAATNTDVTNLTDRVSTNETNIASNSSNITENAKNILANAQAIQANTTAIAAAQAQADKGVANAATAQAAADAAQATADAAIPKPTENCTTLGAKCVLTVGNSGYVWESIERATDETVQ